MKSLIYFILIICPIVASGYGKDDSASWCVSVTPQYLFVNSIRTDVEKRLSSNNWINIGQEFYFGNNLDWDNSADGPTSTITRYQTPANNDVLSGAGLVISDKIFFHPRHSGYSGLYFNYGIGYSHENIGFQDNNWMSYQQNGVTFYGYTLADGKLNIDNYTGFLAFGIATMPDGGIFRFNVNLGGAYQFTKTSSSGLPSSDRNYNRSIFDYAHNGIYPLLTFQFAFLF